MGWRPLVTGVAQGWPWAQRWPRAKVACPAARPDHDGDGVARANVSPREPT